MNMLVQNTSREQYAYGDVYPQQQGDEGRKAAVDDAAVCAELEIGRENHREKLPGDYGENGTENMVSDGQLPSGQKDVHEQNHRKADQQEEKVMPVQHHHQYFGQLELVPADEPHYLLAEHGDEHVGSQQEDNRESINYRKQTKG